MYHLNGLYKSINLTLFTISGVYFILLYAYTTFSGVTLKAYIHIPANTTAQPRPVFTTPSPSGGIIQLENGTAISVKGPEGVKLHFKILVTEGTEELEVRLRGGYGDPDIYVKKKQKATMRVFDKRSIKSGSNEYIQIANPNAGK